MNVCIYLSIQMILCWETKKFQTLFLSSSYLRYPKKRQDDLFMEATLHRLWMSSVHQSQVKQWSKIVSEYSILATLRTKVELTVGYTKAYSLSYKIQNNNNKWEPMGTNRNQWEPMRTNGNQCYIPHSFLVTFKVSWIFRLINA